jgi:hypothetical protein
MVHTHRLLFAKGAGARNYIGSYIGYLGSGNLYHWQGRFPLNIRENASFEHISLCIATKPAPC